MNIYCSIALFPVQYTYIAFVLHHDCTSFSVYEIWILRKRYLNFTHICLRFHHSCIIVCFFLNCASHFIYLLFSIHGIALFISTHTTSTYLLASFSVNPRRFVIQTLYVSCNKCLFREHFESIKRLHLMASIAHVQLHFRRSRIVLCFDKQKVLVSNAEGKGLLKPIYVSASLIFCN